MAKYLVFGLCVIVFLFVADPMEGSSIEYVSEKDLIADPTKCSIPIRGDILKIEDYTQHSNISVITLYGQTSSGSLFFTLDKMNGLPSYFVSIRAFEATIKLYWLETLYKTSYNDLLDLSEFVPIEIQLELGDRSRLKVSMPNGAELVVIDNTIASIIEIYLPLWSKWYYNCPASKVRRTTETTSSESRTEENSSELTFDADTSEQIFI